jgi:F0F1-type ATP synthase membrane subunit b/b'
MLHFNATLVFVLLSFGFFMLLMKAIYFDPMLRIKMERERRLVDDREAAQRFSEDYERLRSEYESALQRARREAQRVIRESREQAQASASQTLTQARQEAQTDMDRQMDELAQWREVAYRQLAPERENLMRLIVRKITEHRPVGTVSAHQHLA